MNKGKIIGKLVWVVLAGFLIAFMINKNVGGMLGVSAGGAIIFWSFVGIWREITDGKKIFVVWKDGGPRIEKR
ncbi:MAG: hypothetical protein KAT77_00415 [Nanoarchaeota archaeon]|nr:hypothetical protein [Nanoarchaeota archaeon]